jgi:hypothetical protein
MTKTTNISIRVPDDMLAHIDRIRDDLQADAMPGQTYTRTNVILWALEGLIKYSTGGGDEPLFSSYGDVAMDEPHDLG